MGHLGMTSSTMWSVHMAKLVVGTIEIVVNTVSTKTRENSKKKVKNLFIKGKNVEKY